MDDQLITQQTPVWRIGYCCAIAYGDSSVITNPHAPDSDDWREWDKGHAAGMAKLRGIYGGTLPPIEDYAPVIVEALAGLHETLKIAA